MNSLEQLYAHMQQLAALRRTIAAGGTDRSDVDRCLDSLKEVRDDILNWPRHDDSFVLRAGSAGEVVTRLDYELQELERDIVYVGDGESALLQMLGQQNPGFNQRLQQLEQQLHGFILSDCADGRSSACIFVTDRDGTINNYCGRYRSSVQAAYNAVFLTRFARRCCRRSVILSSAPLSNGGLIDVSVNPDGVFAYAGSKGREYRDERGNSGALAIDQDQQRVLDRFNERLQQLVDQEHYRVFALIGSSLQFKFGQTTVARQDVEQSIPQKHSTHFLQAVTQLVRQIDPEQQYLRIEDTGKDIEILLTVDSAADTRDFDKGDGLVFLDDELALGLRHSPVLVCGDTASDVPMARVAAERSRRSLAVFVGADSELQQTVCSANSNAGFAASPDVLVAALNRIGISKEQGSDGV